MSLPDEGNRQAAASLLDGLLKLSAEAARIGEYEVAYHAIMAALHAAEAAGSLHGVERVLRLAEEQEKAIESLRPPHRLSSAQAKGRGTDPVYRSLPVHADAVRARLNSRRARP